MGSLTVVFDTNVYNSAFAFRGKPLRCVLRSIAEPSIEIVTSEPALAEIERVCEYEHVPITSEERDQILGILREESTIVHPGIDIEVVDADPDDDMFLECAVEGNATHLISGDSHLTDLGSFRETTILSPAAFLDDLRECGM